MSQHEYERKCTEVLNRYISFCEYYGNSKRANKIHRIWKKGMYPAIYIYFLVKVGQI